MSVTVNINQTGKRKEKINLKFLSKLCKKLDLKYGVYDEAMTFNDYSGKEDIREQLIVIFNEEKKGRGFSLFIDDEYDMELILNTPATKTDVNDFYDFINFCCKKLKLNIFLHDEKECEINEIENLKQQTIDFSKNLIPKVLTVGLQIFGCIYPIVLESNFVEQIKTKDINNAYALYEEYLNKKQQGSYWFSRPLIFDGESDNKYMAVYTILDDEANIFPITPYLPYKYDQSIEKDIVAWCVMVSSSENGSYEVAGQFTFEEFITLVEKFNYPKFDEKHIIVIIDEEFKKEMNL